MLGAPLAGWAPWSSAQRAFVATTASPLVYRAGNRSGKTVALCVRHVLLALGLHPLSARLPPPVRIWLVALDWEFGVGQVLWPELRRWLPKDAVRSILWWRAREPSLPASVVLRNGSEIAFKSAESGREKFQGADLHAVGVDEEIAGDVVEECRARLLRAGGVFAAALTPIRRERWPLDLEREPGARVVRASMSELAAAGRLDAGAVARYLASLPERQRRVRDLGDYAALEGLVYPAFDRARHCVVPRGTSLVDGAGRGVAPYPVPADWPRYAALDPGYAHPCAVVVAAQDPFTGALLVERCWYASGIRLAVWAEYLRGLPRLAEPLQVDADRPEYAELRAAGADVVPAWATILPGIEAVERRLHLREGGRPGLYLVVDGATHLALGRADADRVAWEMEAYRYPPQRDDDAVALRKDAPLQRDDHAMDALRYLIARRDLGTRGPFRLADKRDEVPEEFRALMGQDRPGVYG